jgi:hypothetical protein
LPARISPYAIEHKKSDFSPASLREAFAGQDVVVVTMSGGDAELQARIIDAAVAAGVKRFIPHEFGHDTLKLGIQKRIPKYVGRAKVLHHLQKASQANPGFDWTAIATGYTLDVGIISGDLGLDLEWHSATLHGFGDECFAASSLERVGKVVASVIQRWNDVKNHYLYAAGVITCANEIIRLAESVTDCEWTVGTGDIEDCIREGESRIAKGYPDAGMCLLERSVLYDDELDASAPFQSQESNEVLHLSPESVHTIVENAYHDFRNHGKPGCGCSS